MASKPSFVLSRGTADDLEEIVDLNYDSFPRADTALYMGCPDRTNLPKYRQRCLESMQNDKSDIWILVRDAANGKLVACSNWKVYINGKPDDLGQKPIEWLEGEAYEASAKTLKFMNENRWKNMTGPFVYLHICFTSPEYRRMGAGSLMMQWGVDLMDSLFVPGWIEASPDGNPLYKTVGFYEFDRVEVSGHPVVIMKRDPRPPGVCGGKGSAKA